VTLREHIKRITFIWVNLGGGRARVGYLWVLSQSKNMHFRLIDYCKSTVRSNVSMHGHLLHLSLCWPCNGLVYLTSHPIAAEISNEIFHSYLIFYLTWNLNVGVNKSNTRSWQVNLSSCWYFFDFYYSLITAAVGTHKALTSQNLPWKKQNVNICKTLPV